MLQIILVLAALAAALLAGRFVAGGAQVQHVFMASAAALAVALAFFSAKSGLLLVLFSMLLSPEINVAALAGAGRNVVVRYDDILLLVMFFSWFAKTAVLKDKPLLFRSPAQTPILLFTGVCVVSTALAVLGGKVRWEVSLFYVLKYVEYFLLYFMTYNLVDSREEVRRYFKAAAVVALIVTVYAVWYYLNAGPAARASTPFEAPLGNPEESEPASLGGYYLIVFGLIFGMVSELSFRHFLLAAGAMAAMLPAFILTLSRASYIGLLASGLAAVLLARGRKLFLIAVACLGVIAVSLSPFLAERAKERVEYTYTGTYANNVFETPFGEVRLEMSAAQRVWAWQRSVFYWLPKNILLGNGVTGTGLVDAQLPLVIGETGVLGLIAWLWMIIVCFRVAWRLYKKGETPFSRALALGYIVGLVGLLAQSVGVNTFIIVRIMEPFWFLTAVVMKTAQLEEKVGKGA